MNIESFSTLQIEYNSTDDLFTTFESREWKTWEISHIVQNIQKLFYWKFEETFFFSTYSSRLWKKLTLKIIDLAAFFFKCKDKDNLSKEIFHSLKHLAEYAKTMFIS